MVAAAVSLNTKDFLRQRPRAADSLLDFYKQEIFAYPFSNNYHLICLQNSNLSSKQSVIRHEPSSVSVHVRLFRIWSEMVYMDTM